MSAEMTIGENPNVMMIKEKRASPISTSTSSYARKIGLARTSFGRKKGSKEGNKAAVEHEIQIMIDGNLER